MEPFFLCCSKILTDGSLYEKTLPIGYHLVKISLGNIDMYLYPIYFIFTAMSYVTGTFDSQLCQQWMMNFCTHSHKLINDIIDIRVLLHSCQHFTEAYNKVVTWFCLSKITAGNSALTLSYISWPSRRLFRAFLTKWWSRGLFSTGHLVIPI